MGELDKASLVNCDSRSIPTSGNPFYAVNLIGKYKLIVCSQ